MFLICKWELLQGIVHRGTIRSITFRKWFSPFECSICWELLWYEGLKLTYYDFYQLSLLISENLHGIPILFFLENYVFYFQVWTLEIHSLQSYFKRPMDKHNITLEDFLQVVWFVEYSAKITLYQKSFVWFHYRRNLERRLNWHLAYLLPYSEGSYGNDAFPHSRLRNSHSLSMKFAQCGFIQIFKPDSNKTSLSHTAHIQRDSLHCKSEAG
jgi:hypothetical protein